MKSENFGKVSSPLNFSPNWKKKLFLLLCNEEQSLTYMLARSAASGVEMKRQIESMHEQQFN
jgi:hypothetical protein